MRTTTAFLLLAASIQATAADVVDDVPEQFLGEWNSVIADCGTGANDSVLRIERNHIYFWESDGPIKSVVVHGMYEIAMITELSGEGETWLSADQFRLSPGKDQLIFTSIPGEEFVRYRCPSSK